MIRPHWHAYGRLMCVAAALALASAGGRAQPRGDGVAEIVRRAADLIAAGDQGQQATSLDVLGLLEPVLGRPLEPATAGPAHYLAATAYFRLTRYPEALEQYNLALDSERALNDRAAQAGTLRAIGQLHKNQGLYLEGTAACEQALAIYESLGSSRDVALTFVVMGAIDDLRGDHRAALEKFLRALPVIGSESSPSAGNLLNEIGITQKNLGNYSEALAAYDRALAVYDRLGDDDRRTMTLLNLGLLYGTLGEDDRAVALYQQGLTIARRLANRRTESILLLNLGQAYWRLGDRGRAVGTLRDELTLARQQGARSEENVALRTLGDFDAAAGEVTRAHEEYDEALRIERAIGERASEASTLVSLAELALHQRDSERGRELARQALSIARDTGRPELEWNARLAVARADAAAGAIGPAVEELQSSAAIINDLRAQLVDDASKIAFVDRRQDVFQELAALLMASRRDAEALEASEAGRARALGDLLAQRRIAGKPRDRDALAAVRSAQADFAEAANAVPAGSAASPETRSLVTRRGAALDGSVASLRADHSELANLLFAAAPTAREIAGVAARLDASLIEYAVGDDGLLAWVVTPDGAIHGRRIDATRDQLTSLTRAIRMGLDDARDASARPSPALDRALRDAEKTMIRPLAAWLPRQAGSRLVIIVNGPLALLPFAAIEDGDGKALAARYTLSFAPAASVFLHTAAKADLAAARPRRALIVADPVPPKGSGVDRLPWAREEGRLVAARLGAASVRLLVGSGATEARVKRDAGEFTILHFATHGLVSADRPMASSLMLGEGAGEDGYLRVDEIFNLDLAADLVVLSGCSTGLGRLTGDGVIGLPRAFLYAGTPTVVVSQWDVGDRATAYLMDRFYAALGRGRGKAEALRAAQIETRRRYPHPAWWASFTLVGEP